MKDVDTNEEMQFVFNRWFSRDKDTQQICQELPAIKDMQELHQGRFSFKSYYNYMYIDRSGAQFHKASKHNKPAEHRKILLSKKQVTSQHSIKFTLL